MKTLAHSIDRKECFVLLFKQGRLRAASILVMGYQKYDFKFSVMFLDYINFRSMEWPIVSFFENNILKNVLKLVNVRHTGIEFQKCPIIQWLNIIQKWFLNIHYSLNISVIIIFILGFWVKFLKVSNMTEFPDSFCCDFKSKF